MSRNERNTSNAEASRTDRIGKVFLVLNAVDRRCLICEKVFTQRQAAEHSKVRCYPASHDA
jgi:hypothetical protein